VGVDIRVITETLIPNMEFCAYCDIKNANIFDCYKIHEGKTPSKIWRQCIKNTWGHQ